MSWNFYDNLGKLKISRTTTGTSGINFIMDWGGSVLSSGQKGHVSIPFDCTITEVALLADRNGNAIVDLWKDTYDNFPPDGSDSICISNKPTITSSNKMRDLSLSGWTKIISAGDIISFVLTSGSTIQRLTVALKL